MTDPTPRAPLPASHPPERRRGVAARASAGAAVAALLVVACAQGSQYLWVDQLPEAPPPDHEYRIGSGDVISVRVWQQDAMSMDRARVRDDGKLSVPFLQDVEVSGMTPGELSSRLQAKLKAYFVNPVVTVTLVEQKAMRVSVVGEVAKPGAYEVERGAGVLHALAAAGGLTEYAHRDRIYVLRAGYWTDGNPAPARIRFRYDALSRGERRPSAFRLRSGDVVVVE
jgi:polysaccharide export outer membrane protein